MNSLSDLNFAFATGLIVAFFAMLAGRLILALYGHFKYERAYRKYPRVVRYSAQKTCGGAHQKEHTWQKVSLAVRDLSPGVYTICLECGCIAGNKKYMVSQELIGQAKEALETAKKKQELEAQIQARVAAIIDHEITKFINLNFPKESNDPTFVTKLLELSELTVVTQNKAIEKIASEMEVKALSQDGDFYTWDVEGIKGNA